MTQPPTCKCGKFPWVPNSKPTGDNHISNYCQCEVKTATVDFNRPETYALPPKDDGDVWDEVEDGATKYANSNTPIFDKDNNLIGSYDNMVMWHDSYMHYIKANYTPIPKK